MSVIHDIFDIVDQLLEPMEYGFTEISVKQSQISFCFNNTISTHDLQVLDSLCESFFVSDITTFQDELYANFNNLSEDFIVPEDIENKNILVFLYKFIIPLKDKLCSCPALQFIVSESYIKVFLDLPNIIIDDLVNVNEIFGANGVLQLNAHRPYVLYVKDW